MEDSNKIKEFVDGDDDDDSSTRTPDIVDSFIPTNNSLLMNMIDTSKKFENFNLSNFFEKCNHVPYSHETIIIDIKIEFLKFGQIETKNERFDAEVLVQCIWDDDNILKELVEQLETKKISGDGFSFKNLNEVMFFNKIVNEFKFVVGEHWKPNIVITNAIGELKEELIYKIELVNRNDILLDLSSLKDVIQLNNAIRDKTLKVRVTEKRKVKGVFYQVTFEGNILTK